MFQKKDLKVVSTVHLYKQQIRQIEALAKQSGQSRAQVLRELVDLGLKTLNQGSDSKQSVGNNAEQKKFARQRLLAMGSGYGEGPGRGMHRLDDELYEL